MSPTAGGTAQAPRLIDRGGLLAALDRATARKVIYAKLRARDRSSAVQRARELRLLSAGLAR